MHLLALENQREVKRGWMLKHFESWISKDSNC
jgi:hypothetical protein